MGVELRILGPLEALADGAPLALGGRRPRALLARLLIARGQVVATERLVDELWADADPDAALRSLQVYVSSLRKALGPYGSLLRTDRGGYALALDAADVDAVQFERLVSEARDALAAREPVRAHDLAVEALALWRGPALGDLAYEPWAVGEANRLDDLRLVVLEDRVEADLALARHDTLVPELEALVAEHPLRERLRAQLMLALYRAGRQADALAAYRDARRALVDELGIEPGEELRTLEAAILRQDPTLAAEAPDLRERRHLPAPATALVGRETEIDEVTELLRSADVRLLTLTGPGGSGKTRLALAAAHALVERFPDGVWFVGLAAVRDPSLVAPAVARTLGADDERALASRIRERSLLLVLDNFEQVDDAAPVVAELLAEGAAVKALVTSRGPLRLYGEHEYPVPPLQPDDAVALFEARARAANRTAAVPPEDVAALCDRLDRLPLAIELVAARSRDLDPAAMLAGLARRLELAAGGPRDVAPRQRTLRAAIDWSHDLLEPPARAVFARLGAFADGPDPAAAVAVCEADEDALAALDRASLLVRDETGRVRMLETIREFARERLEASGEAEAVQRRHAEHFLALVEDCERAFRSPEQDRALARLDLEKDNVRTGLAWAAAAGEIELELRLASAFRFYWWLQGDLREGRRRLDDALERGRAVAPAVRASALAAVGVLAFRQGDLSHAQAVWEEALVLEQRRENRAGIARLSAELGNVALAVRDYGRALELYDEAGRLYRLLDEPGPLAQVLANQAVVANASGDVRRGEELLGEAISLQRENGQKQGAAISLHNLARMRLDRDDDAEAARLLRESGELASDIAYREVIAYVLEGFAELALRRGSADRSARLLGAAERLFAETGAEIAGDERATYDAAVETLRERLGAEELELYRAEGRALATDDALAAALELADGV